ncbi:putative phage tail protein [Cohnella abietis]|uniref:Phage portal protein n=1 Tax=Cohnella abietis TaxID=2507935 RepID=A0A3T1D3B9_9BACL|nr:putative phage tail protein [Cohnella abietis]BBI32495.1 hypothetical protein KCTCHS21_18940 [Cohnella abietis]
MSISADMIRQLQAFQRKSKVYKALFDADAQQLDSRSIAITDLRLQMSVDTATWALGIYEQELGIPTDELKPVSERRAVIKSKMRGTGKVDAALIKLVADSYTNGDVKVIFDKEIRITFTSTLGIPPNISDLQVAVDEIRPAHLAVIYYFLYYVYAQLKGYTYGQVRASGKTYGQIYNGGM